MTHDPVQILAERFAAAIAAAFPQAAGADPLITPSRNPKFGDFQSNAAMGLSKTVGRPPREVAQEIVKRVDLAGVAEPVTDASIAGPGFINVTLSAEALARLLGALETPGMGVGTPGAGLTAVVDLCGVNLAKQMHVGHLRATIIGDALARVHERLGYRVVRQNHLGDWGLPIAMVTARLMDLAAAGEDVSRLDLDALERLYRAAKADADADEAGLAFAKRYNLGPKVMAELEEQVGGAREALERAKRTLVKLQTHDPETVRFWQRIVDVTLGECLRTCARLNTVVRAEDTAGESSYAEELAPMVEDLVRRGVAEESEGALVVRVEGIEEPCLVRKRDGAFLYATTDICAIRRRVQTFGASRVVYCVDARQSLHFRQVFGAARKAGYARVPSTGAEASLEHAAFGMVLGEDGRPFKTRSGDNVKLADLLDEATERAARVVAGKSPELPEAERAAVAEAVGIAAIKYTDLSNDRVKDYVFSFDRMLAFEGNTGPYLLYALVRVRRIFAEAAERGVRVDPAAPLRLEAKPEKDLALALLRYPGVVKGVGAALEPHRLCGYLYDVAQAYSAFYSECHVLNAPDEPTRQSRLRLCRLTERVLADGLTLLGMKLLDRM
jgi:arginyl-tRNA synthetase